ncbi:MAG: hydroxyacid dehydrogenase [Rhodobacteraceae bacterium]|nr:hydroxyacid dehydrogenase [Paracoccaceae bacterium]
MIIISEFMDDAAVKRLQRHHAVIYEPDLFDRPDDLRAGLGGARALIVRNRTQVTRALLDHAPMLECIGRLGVGLDNIDVARCGERDISVFIASGANDQCVAEYVIGTSLALLRGAYAVNAQMIRGDWPRNTCAGREAQGKTLGLIGFGAIGQRTARIAAAVGMVPIASDPYLPPDSEGWQFARQAGLPEILETSDVVTLHVPLLPETRHLLDANAFNSMKPGALVINTSRGDVIDEEALVDCLQRGHLAGCALDVYADEPLSVDSGRKFAGLDNIILTPHIAGVTRESIPRVSTMIVEKVLEHLQSRN